MTSISPVKIWRRKKHLTLEVGKEGTIITYTIIRVAPGKFTKYPCYPVVIVAYDNGEQMIGQLVDCEESDVVIGKKVISVFRRSRLEGKDDVIAYCVKFKLA